MKYYLISIVLTLMASASIGCGSSVAFRLANDKDKPIKGDPAKLLAAIDKLAQENELNTDNNCKCDTKFYLCYMGDPYHIFTVTIEQDPAKNLRLEILQSIPYGSLEAHREFKDKLVSYLKTEYKATENVTFVQVPAGTERSSSVKCSKGEAPR